MTAAQNIITARTVPLSSLVIECAGWTNPRTITGLDTREIEELGENIKLRGIMDPPKVQRVKLANGEIIELVIDGQRRVMAARDALTKNSPIPVVDLSEDVIELTPEAADRLLDAALTSLRHEGLSSYELSAVAEGMAKRGRVYDVIGLAIGKSKSWVSRMLKARSTAAPKLMIQWRKGDITDEQFKELAEVADPEKQAEKAKVVVEARRSGDKAEARVLSKEVKETERASKPAKVTNGHHSMAKGPAPVRPAVTGEQRDLFGNSATATKAAGPKPPSKAAIEDLLGMAAKRPPTADYVKGLLDGVRYSQGILEPDKFGKAWMQYVSRIEGRPRPSKKVKEKSAPRAKVKKAAKARKPAKKAGGKKGKR